MTIYHILYQSHSIWISRNKHFPIMTCGRFRHSSGFRSILETRTQHIQNMHLNSAFLLQFVTHGLLMDSSVRRLANCFSKALVEMHAPKKRPHTWSVPFSKRWQKGSKREICFWFTRECIAINSGEGITGISNFDTLHWKILIFHTMFATADKKWHWI